MTHPISTTTIEDTTNVVTTVLVDTLNLPPDEVVPEADLKQDLGLDSLDLLELLSAIETHVGRPVDDAEIRTIRTVADAVGLIHRLHSREADR